LALVPGGAPVESGVAREVREPSFQPRAAIAGKDARTLAHDILAMSEDEFRAAFKGSPMKRAKAAGLTRNAVAVLDASPGSSRSQS
jgi:epoxyqueuosine reductase QueG